MWSFIKKVAKTEVRNVDLTATEIKLVGSTHEANAKDAAKVAKALAAYRAGTLL